LQGVGRGGEGGQRERGERGAWRPLSEVGTHVVRTQYGAQVLFFGFFWVFEFGSLGSGFGVWCFGFSVWGIGFRFKSMVHEVC
jgi:hypothetical protein